jgi:hypothetical protein
MLQREQSLYEQRKRIIKASDKKFWIEFDKQLNNQKLKFKIWIDISTVSMNASLCEVKEWVENLYISGKLTLENKKYEFLADELYEAISEEYPDKNIWISIKSDDLGLLAKYETRTPSTFLKI